MEPLFAQPGGYAGDHFTCSNVTRHHRARSHHHAYSYPDLAHDHRGSAERGASLDDCRQQLPILLGLQRPAFVGRTRTEGMSSAVRAVRDRLAGLDPLGCSAAGVLLETGLDDVPQEVVNG